jgi:hypothetical protein
MSMVAVLGLLSAGCGEGVTAVASGDTPLRSETILVPQVEQTIVGLVYDVYLPGATPAGCRLFDAGGEVVFTESAFTVGPQTNLGNTLVRCEADVGNPEGRTIRFDAESTGGTTCFANGMESIKWQQVITPEGSARLVCTFPGY